MQVTPSKISGCVFIAATFFLLGCTELNARSHAREGNHFYKDGEYEKAVVEYEKAEALAPQLATVALNKGLACRQLMVPGSKTKENEGRIDRALAAFRRLKDLSPDDPRGEQLYTETLFLGDRFEMLEVMYKQQADERPNDPAPANALIQVYGKWLRPQETLTWTIKRADIERTNAEMQYAVGLLIYDMLSQKGGGPDKAAFDPRPREEGQEPAVPPPFLPGDYIGEERVKLADQGITYLERALVIRPNYRDALAYINLLYRQKSFAFLTSPADWQVCIDRAETFRQKALQIDPAAKPVEAAKEPPVDSAAPLVSVAPLVSAAPPKPEAPPAPKVVKPVPRSPAPEPEYE